MIRFKTEAYANIDMFDDVALQLLKMMGHSGTVPSAILPEDIPNALANLKGALEQNKIAEASPPDTDADEDELETSAVSIGIRAYPLIELLNAAAKQNRDVMWVRI
jgi:hypothetical protein